MDTRFSMAIQLLILIALSPEPMSSAAMADSVGTNPSHVRRIIGLLKQQKLVHSHQGMTGFRLLPEPEEVDLLTVYRAVSGSERYHAFDLHQNPSDSCLVGRHICPVLSGMFAEMEQSMQEALAARTLADCIAALKERVEADGPNTV